MTSHLVGLTNASVIGDVLPESADSADLQDQTCEHTLHAETQHTPSTAAYVLPSCELPVEVAVLLHHALGLLFKVLSRVVTPPVEHVAVLVEITPCEETKWRVRGEKKTRAESKLNPTIVVEAVRDFMPDDHSYSAEVEGLVLMLAEERGLQDSCRKNLSGKKKNDKGNCSNHIGIKI